MNDFTDNLLGALSLAIVDSIEGAAHKALGMGGQAAGALVLLHLRPGVTVNRLAERLRLSQPGMVRLVDRLAKAGLVQRNSAQDRRAVQLTLTKQGVDQLLSLRRVRANRLSALTSDLGSKDRATLRRILGALMKKMTPDVVSAYANCRLCDTATCQSEGCPIDELADESKNLRTGRPE